jgi:anti-anti-sigma factor
MGYIDGQRCACGHDYRLHDGNRCVVWGYAGDRVVSCSCKGLQVDRRSPRQPGVIVAVRTSADSLLVQLVGELDVGASEKLDASIQNVRGDRLDVVIVDLTLCRYLDSSVLAVLRKKAGLLNDRFRIVLPEGAPLRHSFETASAGGFARVHATIADASRQTRMPNSSRWAWRSAGSS